MLHLDQFGLVVGGMVLGGLGAAMFKDDRPTWAELLAVAVVVAALLYAATGGMNELR